MLLSGLALIAQPKTAEVRIKFTIFRRSTGTGWPGVHFTTLRARLVHRLGAMETKITRRQVWGVVLGQIGPEVPPPVVALRRLAVNLIGRELRRAPSAIAAAQALGITYRALVRLVGEHPELRKVYDRTARSEFRNRTANDA